MSNLHSLVISGYEASRGAFISGVHAKAVLFEDWGGAACRAYVSPLLDWQEGATWLVLLVASWFALPGTNLRLATQPSKVAALDYALALVHALLYAQLCWWKYCDSCLIVLLQPCHILLFLEGLALVSPQSTAVSVLLLPALSGTALAMAVPGTSGLDATQTAAYWVQHVLIQAVPLYLLCRRDFAAWRQSSLGTALLGVWILQAVHWCVYLPLDATFLVNVEFMLCPTLGMRDIFALLPAWLLWPSYRSSLAIVVGLGSVGVAYLYMAVAWFVHVVTSAWRPRRRKALHRVAVGSRDAAAVMRVTNLAFQADTFFKKREYWDRFDLATVEGMMASERGVFLLWEEQQEVVGSIYVDWDALNEGKQQRLVGHISAVSVLPSFGRRGLGKALVRAAEEHLLHVASACKASSVAMEMGVINLRKDLFPFYEQQGYVTAGEMRPNNAELARIVLPELDVCCVRMTKELLHL